MDRPFDPAQSPESQGFAPFGLHGFEEFLGRFYSRPSPEGQEFLTQVQAHHCNSRGDAHGGFMLALADTFLSGTCHLDPQVEVEFVTVDLSHEFLGAAPQGAWVHAQGRLRKHGRSLMFVECEFHVGQDLIGIARCVMKKINKTKTPH